VGVVFGSFNPAAGHGFSFHVDDGNGYIVFSVGFQFNIDGVLCRNRKEAGLNLFLFFGFINADGSAIRYLNFDIIN
jgi:hypothetical protein